MIRIQVSLDKAAYAGAKAEAARQRISLAEFLRRAVASALAERHAEKRPWMRHAGRVSSGDSKASVSVDAVVYRRGRV
jgi:hypothetical protein